MQLSVNPSQRHAKMRAHTATHLLHSLIQNYIPTTQQAGSLVDDDYVRFDYTSDDMLTPTQISEINTEINRIIGLARDVTTTEMSYDDAVATGAKAFFQDKYGDVVRVVQVLGDDSLTSVELCGGTHVSNTREIGAFVIVEQSPVASGTKRLVAYTGPKTIEYSSSLETELQQIATKLGVTPKQIDEKLSKTLKEFEHIKSSRESLKNYLIGERFKSSDLPEIDSYRVFKIKIHLKHELISISDVVTIAKAINIPAIIIDSDGGYAIVGGSDAKARAQSQGLRGGGSEGLFQGKDTKILDL